MPDGEWLSYHRSHIEVRQNKTIVKRFFIPITNKERFLGWNKYATRLLRLGIRTAQAIDNNHIVFYIGNLIHEFNIHTGELSDGWFCGTGIRPLIFTTVKDINGFDNGIYFGGYLGNMDKKPVHIYKRIGTDKWDIVYTFPQGIINHVHNIVPDPYRNCLWIFTGDFDEAAAIWKVTENFKKVERVLCNNQKYRGCVAYALPEGLLYATDAPFADNFIYLLNPQTLELKEIFPLHGSCIYGTKWKENYVFSSTVEGDGRNMSRLEFWFRTKTGAGIKDNYVHLYCGNLKDGFHEICKEKKDWLPLFPFQFGVFKFPYGHNNTDTLYFQPVATTKHDLDLMSITL